MAPRSQAAHTKDEPAARGKRTVQAGRRNTDLPLSGRVLRLEVRLNTVESEVELLRQGQNILLGQVGRLHDRMGEVVDKVAVIVLGAEQKFTEALNRMEAKLDQLIGDPYATQPVPPRALDAPGASAATRGQAHGTAKG